MSGVFACDLIPLWSSLVACSNAGAWAGLEAPLRRARSCTCRRSGRQDRQRDEVDHLAGVPEPYRLRVVAHSLGGAALLVYAVQCRRQRRPHHMYRLILLTPAGFLQKAPLVRTLLSRSMVSWSGL